MAQTKTKTSQGSEEVPEIVAASPEPELLNIRFAFGVWVAVFSLLALSIVWDSIYGLLFRSPPSVVG